MRSSANRNVDGGSTAIRATFNNAALGGAVTERELQLTEKLDLYRDACRSLIKEVFRLKDANAELCAQRDAIDHVLGNAIDLLRHWMNGERE